MRDINKLVKWYFCSLNDLNSIKDYLEEMALKGWMLEEIRMRRMIFRSFQPQRLLYSVKAFDKSSTFASSLTDVNRELVEICEAADWHFVSSCGKIHVFCTANENAVPIQTDPKIELKFINKSMLKQNWFNIPLMLIILIDFLLYTQNRDLRFYTDSNYITLECMWVFIIVLYAVLIIDHIVWYISAKQAIAKGMELPQKSSLPIIIILVFWVIILAIFVLVSIISENFLFLISTAVILALVLALAMVNIKVKKLIKTKTSVYIFPLLFLIMIWIVPMFKGISGFPTIFGVGHQEAHGISYNTGDGGVGFTTVYNDSLPLTLQDLGIATKGIYSRERDDMGRFLAQETDYTDSSPINSNATNISYKLYTTKYHWVYSKITDYYLSGNALAYWRFQNCRVISVDGANKVYASVVSESNQTNYYNYLVLYNDKIVFLQASFEMKNGQLETCVEKLK